VAGAAASGQSAQDTSALHPRRRQQPSLVPCVSAASAQRGVHIRPEAATCSAPTKLGSVAAASDDRRQATPAAGERQTRSSCAPMALPFAPFVPRHGLGALFLARKPRRDHSMVISHLAKSRSTPHTSPSLRASFFTVCSSAASQSAAVSCQCRAACVAESCPRRWRECCPDCREKVSVGRQGGHRERGGKRGEV
jgi:hypothetical protein